jgi:hypothetical protein
MNSRPELSPALENQLRLAAATLQQNEREQFINSSRKYINGDLNFLDFVLQIKSLFNSPETLKAVFGDFVHLINHAATVATNSADKQRQENVDRNIRESKNNNVNDNIVPSKQGSKKEYNQKEYESDVSWKEADEELEIDEDDDLFVPRAETKRSRKLDTNSGPTRKKSKRSGSYSVLHERERQRRPANFWSPEESEKLLEIINKSEYGPKKWKLIAKTLNAATGGNKTPSQCSQHYHRVIAPGINKGAWTKEEDEKLLQLYKQYGSCWSLVCRHMPNRTDTQCARRWAKLQRTKDRTKCRTAEEHSDLSVSDDTMCPEMSSDSKKIVKDGDKEPSDTLEPSKPSNTKSPSISIPLRRTSRIPKPKSLPANFDVEFEDNEDEPHQDVDKRRRHQESREILDKVDENDIVSTLVEIKNDSALRTKNDKTIQEDKPTREDQGLLAGFIEVALDNKYAVQPNETIDNEKRQTKENLLDKSLNTIKREEPKLLDSQEQKGDGSSIVNANAADPSESLAKIANASTTFITSLSQRPSTTTIDSSDFNNMDIYFVSDTSQSISSQGTSSTHK